jgi:hypothetical protein
MDEVTQQNAALVEEAAAAAESMQEQAGSLVQAVAVFRLDGSAARTQSAPKPAPAPERRGPERAVNVARLHSKAGGGKPARDAARKAPPKVKAAGGEEHWEEF